MCGFDGGDDGGFDGGDVGADIDSGADVGGDFESDVSVGDDIGTDSDLSLDVDGLGDIDVDTDAGTELAPDVADDALSLQDDGALPNDVGYIQGDNEEGLDGTCGIATVAGNLNEVTGSELSENDVLEFALENDITEDGATSQTDALELYDTLSEQTPGAGDVDIEKVSLDENNMDDINAALQDGAVLDASIDADVLWGEKDNFESIDHAIGIDEPVFDETGEVVGYNIRDTGSGKDFATTEELEDAGLFDTEQILISKDE
jgi:hypothetical protein